MTAAKRSFDGLRRHRKRLLAPFSAFQADLKRAPFFSVSWADDGAAELLWLCCLIHRHGIARCAPLISVIAEIARGRRMELRGHFLFFSRLILVDHHELTQSLIGFHDKEVAESFLQILSAFRIVHEVHDHKRASRALKSLADELRVVVRIAINRESTLALKSMALFIKCELESEALVMPRTMMNPRSLDEYPDSAESKITAGLLRAYMNGMLGKGSGRSEPPFCEKLWPAIASMEECV